MCAGDCKSREQGNGVAGDDNEYSRRSSHGFAQVGTQVFDGISYVRSISGQFTETTIDALVLVEAGRQPPCAFTARWAGPKSGDPNVIP